MTIVGEEPYTQRATGMPRQVVGGIPVVAVDQPLTGLARPHHGGICVQRPEPPGNVAVGPPFLIRPSTTQGIVPRLAFPAAEEGWEERFVTAACHVVTVGDAADRRPAVPA